MNYCYIGFNSDRSDPVSGVAHLGNGYRSYHPFLLRFTAPDSSSPFETGGVNPYTYCSGDPVNRADPSGHMSTGQWGSMAAGMVAGIALSIMTEGAALPAVVSLMAMAASDAAVGAGAELLADIIDGQRINWKQVGIAAGMGAAATLGGYGLGRAAARLKDTLRRPFRGLMMPGEWAAERRVMIGALQMEGQFRHPVFLGVFRPEGSERSHMAFSFVDNFGGAERLNIVGPASRSAGKSGSVRVSMGAGTWTGSTYQPTVMGSIRISDLIQEQLVVQPSIRNVRIGLSGAGRLFQGELIRSLRNKGINISLSVPETGVRLSGVVHTRIETFMDELNRGIFESEGAHKVSPGVFQEHLDMLSTEFANTPSAFNIDFN